MYSIPILGKEPVHLGGQGASDFRSHLPNYNRLTIRRGMYAKQNLVQLGVHTTTEIGPFFVE